MNTRKHPRTLNEAFTKTADYASSVTRYDRRDSFNYVVCGIAAVSLLLILFIWG
jgi:hypothetical protein